MRYAIYSATLALAALVVGCSQSPNVPATASNVATGGQDVSYTAPRDGKIYLQDDLNKRLVYSGEVHGGENVRFSRQQDAVFLNGAMAAQSIPTPWHEHTLYFEPSPQQPVAHMEGAGVPPMASGVATGGQDVSFTAPSDGKVYLQDNQDKRLVYSGEIHKGEVVHFSRAQDAVFVNGSMAAQGIPSAQHDHTMFFQAMDAQQAGEHVHGDRTSTDSTLRVPVKVQVRQPDQN
jgi:hypothetical protein